MAVTSKRTLTCALAACCVAVVVITAAIAWSAGAGVFSGFDSLHAADIALRGLRRAGYAGRNSSTGDGQAPCPTPQGQGQGGASNTAAADKAAEGRLEPMASPHPVADAGFKFAFFTYIAGDATRYIKWASLQAVAARTFIPEAEFNIVVASTVNPKVPAALRALGYRVVVEEPFQETRQHGPTWVNQLTKLKLWTRTQYDVVCHLDSDVIFWTNITAALIDECKPRLFGEAPSNANSTAYDASHTETSPEVKIELCAYEEAQCGYHPGGGFDQGNRNKWGQPYVEASVFCLRPSMETYNALMEGGVKVLQEQGEITMHGKVAYTEQDFINLFFKGHTHRIPCQGGRGGGKIHHTKQVEGEWSEAMKKLGKPPTLELYTHTKK